MQKGKPKNQDKTLLEVKKWLYNAQYMRKSIENLKILLEEKKKETIGATVYGSPIQKYATTNSPVENIFLEISEIEDRICSLENRIIIIDNSISALPDDERKIVTMRFFNRKEWKEITDEVAYCMQQCHNKKEQALKTLALCMFGRIGF